jgi:cell division protein FtsB
MKRIKLFEAFVASLKENKTKDADLEQEIKRLEDENPLAYKKEISRLKVRLSAVNMFKKFNKKK